MRHDSVYAARADELRIFHMKYGMPRKCEDERRRLLMWAFLAMGVLALMGMFGRRECREVGVLRARGAALLAQADAWMKSAGGVDAADWKRMAEEKRGERIPVLAENPEGNQLRRDRVAASLEERTLAGVALESLGEFVTDAEGTQEGWLRLRGEIEDAAGAAKKAMRGPWGRKKRSMEALERLESALSAGETAIARHGAWAAAQKRVEEVEEAESMYWRDVEELQRQAKKAMEEAESAHYGEEGGYGERLMRMGELLRAGDEALKERCYEDAAADFSTVRDEGAWLKENIGLREAARRERGEAEKLRGAAKTMDGERLAMRLFMAGMDEWQKAAESYDDGRFPEAVEGWERAGRTWKEAEGEARRRMVEEALSKARSETKAGKWLKAYEEVEKALALSPESPDVLEVLSELEGHLPAGTARTVVLPGGATMELVWCSPGDLRMGETRKRNLPARFGHSPSQPSSQVTMTNGFWLAKYEVTQKQWKSVMGSNPATHKGDDLPVETVSWTECEDFCRRAGHGLRLPTEQEWEYACRAGSLEDYEGSLDDMGWHKGNSSEWENDDKRCSHPVGTKAANKWGLHDMHGNVWEWCDSWYDGRRERVCRGGAYDNSAQFCTSGFRGHALPSDKSKNRGFRPICGTR